MLSGITSFRTMATSIAGNYLCGAKFGTAKRQRFRQLAWPKPPENLRRSLSISPWRSGRFDTQLPTLDQSDPDSETSDHTLPPEPGCLVKKPPVSISLEAIR
jgi:hypothetical protein